MEKSAEPSKMHANDSIASLSQIEVANNQPSPDPITEGHVADSHADSVQNLSMRSIFLMLAILGTYFATMVQLVGSGLLAQTIAGALGASSQYTWVTSSLIIVSATLTPSVSQAADLWGRKWLVVGGTLFGLVGALIVSRSNSIGMAIAGQAIGGLAQPTQALTHTIMSEILPRKYRPHAQATVQVAVGLASVTGLYVGGALCKNDRENFRIYFYLVAAIFFVTSTLFAILYNPPTRELQRQTISAKIRHFDIPATLLTIVGFLGLCIGLGWSQSPYSWSNAHVLAPFVIGICGFATLAVYATWIRRDGIYHQELFRSRNFIITEIALFAEGFLFLAFNNYVPFQISVLYDKDLFQTALQFGISWWLVPVGAIATGYLSTKLRILRIPIVFSLVLMAAFFGAMASTTLSSSAQIWGFVVLFGFALGVAMNTLIVLAQLSTPVRLISTATGLNLATRAGGGTVGLAVYNAIFNAALQANLGSKVAQAAISHGLPPTSVGQVIAALVAHDERAMMQIPGINIEIIQASVVAMKEAFNIGFRNVYIASAAMAGFSIIVTLFIRDPKDQFTHSVDAPVYVNKRSKEVSG